MANGTEAGRVDLGLHLNSKPAEQQMSGMRSRFSAMGSRLGDAIKGSMTRSFSGIGSSFGSMLTKVLSVAAVTAFTKKCLDLGSDLAEVQNVVDVTFSSMSGKVDAFAKDAAATFGLSETMAKQFTGTFGAMSKAFGFTEAQAYDMSTTLTGLAGDVASFYNLDQEEAFTKLKAIFTGETEGLKSLGVVMTQTALDQFAMEKGFGKTTAAMTEQEKAALRYQFVLDKLSGASGDFARTSDGWANQVRLLKLQFDSLRAAIGQGLIAALTPAIKALNGFMGALVKAANTFKSFVYSLMGKKSEDMAAGAGAVASALGDITGGAGDAADSLGGVGDAATGAGKSASAAAKEIRRSLAGFDEITKLLDDSANGGSGGSGSAGGIGSAISSELGDVSSALKGEDFDIGNTIADFLANAVKAGDWEALGTALGQKVNSAIDKIPWGAAGAKFGSGLNGVFSTTYWTLDEINFTNIGASIATFVNNAIASVDFDIVGRLPVKKFTSILDTIIGFLETLNWGQVGTAIGDFLRGALSEATDWLQSKDWGDIAGTLQTGIENMITGLDAEATAQKLSGFLTNLISSFGDLVAGLDVGSLIMSINSFVNDLIVNMDYGEILQALGKAVVSIVTQIPGMILSSFQAPIDLLSQILEKLGLEDVSTFLDENILAPMRNASAALSDIFSPEVISFAIGAVGPVFKDAWQSIKQTFVDGANGVIGVVNDMISIITGSLSDTGFGQWLANKLGIESLDAIRIPLIPDIDPPPGSFMQQYKEDIEANGPVSVSAKAGITDVEDQVPKKTKQKGIRGFTAYPERMSLSYLPEDDKAVDVLAKYTDANDLIPQSKRLIPAEANIISKKLSPTFQRPTIKSVADLVSADDNIRNKSLYGWDAKLATRTDEIKDKKLLGFDARLATRTDDIKDRNLTKGFDALLATRTDKITDRYLTNGFDARLTTRTDKINDRVLHDFAAKFGVGIDNIKNRNMEGFIAAFTKSENALPALAKTLPVTAKYDSSKDGLSSSEKTINTTAYMSSRNLSSAVTKSVSLSASLSVSNIDSVVSTIKTKVKNALNLRAAGGVFSGGVWRSIPQYAGGTADAHGSMFIAGEAGPEVVGHIGGRTEVLNRSQLASTMSYAVSAGLSAGVRGVIANAVPRLAIIGQSVSRGEEHLSQLAQYAAAETGAGGTAKVIELLTQVLAAVLSIDPDITLDGESVKSKIVSLINRRTLATGTCEIIV